MGITRYQAWLNKRYPNISSRAPPPDIDSLLIDMNQMIHNSVKEVSLETGQDDIWNKSIERILRNLYLSLKRWKPKRNLVIAVDGVAPAAKLFQQKTRRFSPPSDLSEKGKYDTHPITPSTDFMFALDVAIQDWLMRRGRSLLPKNVVYSSHMTPGEGEHKIFQHIKNGDLDMSGKGAHLIYSQDTDLFILSVINRYSNFFLFKADRNEYVNMDLLGELIIRDLTKNKKTSDENIMLDYATFTTLVGDDFMPKLVSYTDTDLYMDVLFQIYIDLDLRLTEKVKVNDKSEAKLSYRWVINWDNFIIFLKEIFKREKGFYLWIHQQAITEDFRPFPEIMECGEIVGKKKNKVEFEFDFKEFDQKWIYKNFKGYSDSKDVDYWCEEYLKIQSWVLAYYTGEDVSKYVFFRYYYPPTLNMLLKYMAKTKDRSEWTNVMRVEGEREINCIVQLMSVLPPRSVYLLPPLYREAYMSEMIVISPENPEIEKTGIVRKFSEKPHVPPINLVLAFNVFDRYTKRLPKKYQNRTPFVLKKDFEYSRGGFKFRKNNMLM